MSLTSTFSDPENIDPVVAALALTYYWQCTNMFNGSTCNVRFWL